MTLVLVRVDCRLIHGQVLEAWVPHTHADCLLVANDDAAEDIVQRSIMEMAVPPHLEVAILTVAQAAADLMAGRWSRKRVLLLFADCEDVLRAMQAGLRFNRLNLGNMACTPEKRQITCTLSLGPEDFQCLNEIIETGVSIEVRPVPHEHPTDISQYITACHSG